MGRMVTIGFCGDWTRSALTGYGIFPSSHENDTLGRVSEDDEIDPFDDAWSYFTSHGFDEDADPLLRYDPADFDRSVDLLRGSGELF